MNLDRSFPTLFAVPNKRESLQGICASVLLAWLGWIIYFWYKVDMSIPIFYLFSLLIIVHGVIVLKTTRMNIMFLFRYFLVWILVGSTTVIWAVYSGDVLVAPFGIKYQTLDTTRVLVFAGLLSLCGSLVGWHMAAIFCRKSANIVFYLSPLHRRKLMKAGLILSVMMAVLYYLKSGGAVSSGSIYGQKDVDIGVVFGVYNVFHFTGIALLILASIKNTSIRLDLWFIGVLTLLVGVITGSRADFLPQLFIMFVLLFNRKVVRDISRITFVRLSLYVFLGVALLFVGYLLAIFVAIWRTGVDLGSVFSLMADSERGMLLNGIYGHPMLYLETGNMMLGGLYAAIVNVQKDITGYLFGESYFNWLLRAPPGFLGLPRPEGLEWSTSILGVKMAQGGIFEVAEAYWNFGLIGSFGVSCFISFVFGWLLCTGLKRRNYFLLTWYLVMGFMSFRAVWYQNFSYFRIMTIMLMIYCASYLCFKWYIRSLPPDQNVVCP